MTIADSDDVLTSGEERLHDALIQFTACIGNALDDICSYGLTIGEAYVPFDPDPEDDCEDGDIQCSQVWVRVMGVQPMPSAVDGWDGERSAPPELRLDLEVGVIRCIEVPEGGEAPVASDVLVAAIQAMTDMNAIFCAAMACPAWESITVGQWSPSGPLGGQYGGTWTFTVEA